MGHSENNKKAKYDRLTAKGRRQLEVETTNWAKLSQAIVRILETA